MVLVGVRAGASTCTVTRSKSQGSTICEFAWFAPILLTTHFVEQYRSVVQCVSFYWWWCLNQLHGCIRQNKGPGIDQCDTKSQCNNKRACLSPHSQKNMGHGKKTQRQIVPTSRQNETPKKNSSERTREMHQEKAIMMEIHC